MGLADEKAIYLQIAEKIEDAILSGAFAEEEQVPSTTEIAVHDKINPATALKGVSLLAEQGILYKKRGLGMFVCPGATEKIRSRRKREFYGGYVRTMLCEAKKLGLDRNDLLQMIERGYDDEQN